MTVLPPRGTPVKVIVDKKTLRGVVTGHTPCFAKVKLEEDGREILRKIFEVINDGDPIVRPRRLHNAKADPSAELSSQPPPLKPPSFSGSDPSAELLSSQPAPEETTSTVIDTVPSSVPEPPYTCSQADPNKSTFPFMQGGHRIGCIKMLTPEQRDPLSQTLVGHLFGDRVRKFEYCDHGSHLKNFKAPKQHHDRGYCFELLAHKLHSDRGKFGRLQRPELFYFVTQGPGLKPIDLREALKSLFDIESLAPSKAASRMELLLTPSKMTRKTKEFDAEPMIFDLSSDEFERIEENCHAGCGFLSRKMAFDLLGEGIDGQRATTIQCRATVPGIGLMKGLFKIKEGIDKIQVPSSMIKIGSSQSTNPATNARLQVKRSFPSSHNRYVAKFLDGEEVCDTGLKKLQVPLSDMIEDVLLDCGVPMELLVQYNEKRIGRGKEREATRRKTVRSRREKHKQNKKVCLPGDDLHVGDTYCVGVADPTSDGVIPNGHVFVPGLPDHVDSVLVTRPPCMDKQDVLRLPVFKTKPRTMSEAEWDTLNSQHFGDICFGNGSIPLPSLIAGGDLDGDLYFVMWETNVVECIAMADIPKLERDARLSKRHAAKVDSSSLRSNHGDWFDRMQGAVADVGFAIKVGELIGSLYNEAKVEWKSDSKIYDDYVALGRAYKQSLDLKKHGDKVQLPAHLWDAVSKELHEFLVDE